MFWAAKNASKPGGTLVKGFTSSSSRSMATRASAGSHPREVPSGLEAAAPRVEGVVLAKLPLASCACLHEMRTFFLGAIVGEGEDARASGDWGPESEMEMEIRGGRGRRRGCRVHKWRRTRSAVIRLVYID
ncbi:hypothetical protein PVAP13_4NG207933 [Panicum virgatum]|uniref:Uncharacterized protein n=1 Tax=Panicum virgatum TaxID=38727 RepID=A0A8T0TCU4_PANVG|nr:hypothetical protein PVAP13_4NG207933 [Panicum virgatum]